MTFQPIDLSIELKAVTHSRQVLNGGPKGSTLPGWFLTVQQNEGYDLIAGPVQLSPDEVVVITDVIDRLIDHTHLSHWRVTSAAQTCSQEMRNQLRRQLEAAEATAAKIPELKKLLGEV